MKKALGDKVIRNAPEIKLERDFSYQKAITVNVYLNKSRVVWDWCPYTRSWVDFLKEKHQQTLSYEQTSLTITKSPISCQETKRCHCLCKSDTNNQKEKKYMSLCRMSDF